MSTKASDKYKKENYDTIIFPMAKGNRDIIKEHCKFMNETYHDFLRRAIYNAIQEDRMVLLKLDQWTNPDIKIRRQTGWKMMDKTIKDSKIPTYDEWYEYVTHPWTLDEVRDDVAQTLGGLFDPEEPDGGEEYQNYLKSLPKTDEELLDMYNNSYIVS